MTRMPFTYPPEPERGRPPLKPWLWLALTLSVLAFCSTLLTRA
jgi:hypothetical protein